MVENKKKEKSEVFLDWLLMTLTIIFILCIIFLALGVLINFANWILGGAEIVLPCDSPICTGCR